MNNRTRLRLASAVFFYSAMLAGANADTPNGVVSNLPSQVQQVQVAAPFDGTWEGKIIFDKEAFLAPTSTPPEGIDFRIEIHDPIVKVFIKDDSGFAEANPGTFHISPVDTNAVIFGTQSQGGSWNETWTFTLTQRSDRTLVVEYTRLVNNVGMPPDDPLKIFGTRGIGDFKRIAP
jgi:hypothetical protein